MVNYKTKLILFGGHNGITALNDLQVFDIKRNCWLSEVRTNGIPPSPRFFHSAAVVSGKMYQRSSIYSYSPKMLNSHLDNKDY